MNTPGEIEEFEKGLSKFSSILRENIDSIALQLEEIQLDNTHNY